MKGKWKPYVLLIPSLILMVGVFIAGLCVFFQYSFYSYTDGKIVRQLTLDSYRKFLTDSYYWKMIGDTIWLACKVTVLSALLSYPLAYIINRVTRPGVKLLLIFISFLPLLVSVIVRSYGWLIILAKEGLVNYVLQLLGIVEEPIKLAYTTNGVVIALVHIFLPFMILPILTALSQMDRTLKLASSDLGAGRLTTFLQITFPLTIRGLATGVQLVFLLCITAYATPTLIGGGKVITIPGFIYQQTMNINWPIASVASVVLIVISVVFVFLLNAFVDSRMLRKWMGGH